MIHITEHKKNLKMSGFISINTSVFENSYCKERHKNKKLVCSHCYGNGMERTYTNFHKRIVGNTKELITTLSEESLTDVSMRIKEQNKRFIRYHSVGELINEAHLGNFYEISKLVPDSIFGLWTKRKDLVYKYGVKKPDNFSLVYSNPVLNKPLKWIPEGFNGLFNVVTYDYCKEHDIVPNCHGRCIECLNCYRPDKKYIAVELLKSDQTGINKGRLEPLE